MTLKCWESKQLKEFLMDKLESRWEGEEKFVQKYADGDQSAVTPSMRKFHQQLGDVIDALNDIPMCGESGTKAVERSKSGNIKKEKKKGSGGKRKLSDYQKHMSVCGAPHKHGAQGEKMDFQTCVELWKAGQKMHGDYKEQGNPKPEEEPEE